MSPALLSRAQPLAEPACRCPSITHATFCYYYHARAGELQERAAGRPTRLHSLLFWFSYGSPCQHCVNMASPHPKGLLSLRVAQVSRQKRPLLAAKGHVWVGGHLLGRRGRECRRPGWSWLVAGWRWWPRQARCIREGVLEGCRDRHAVVPCKALLTGIHLDIENKRLLREPSASTLALPETLGERLNNVSDGALRPRPASGPRAWPISLR